MIEAIQLFSYVSKCGLHVYNVNEKCKIKIIFCFESCKFKFFVLETIRQLVLGRKEGRKGRKERRKKGWKERRNGGRAVFSMCCSVFYSLSSWYLVSTY